MIAVQKSGAKKSDADKKKDTVFPAVIAHQRHGPDDPRQKRRDGLHNRVQLGAADSSRIVAQQRSGNQHHANQPKYCGARGVFDRQDASLAYFIYVDFKYMGMVRDV
jgi:hypothetical protein